MEDVLSRDYVEELALEKRKNTSLSGTEEKEKNGGGNDGKENLMSYTLKERKGKIASFRSKECKKYRVLNFSFEGSLMTS